MAQNDQVVKLHNLENVNTVMGMVYDSNGVYRAGFEPGVFYNTILLDTLKYGEENYVHLKHAENLTIRKGEKVARFRRWAGLTPTLRPLKEGIPPAPDKHAYETLEVGNVFSFGRWSEYTDRVDLSIINDVIAERSLQYGEVANQTKELFARKTWLSSPNEFFAKFRAGFGDLKFGDEVTLDDLRFLVARMKRMLVKPIGGKFNYICSTEFINSLIDDPRVKQYMEIENTTGRLWGDGQPFDMFELSFIPTMLDEFAYPDTEWPGVYELADGKEAIRLYAISSNTIYYLDVHQDFAVKSGVAAKTAASGVTYLKDGTAVENIVSWELPTDATALIAGTVAATGEPTALAVVARKSVITDGVYGDLVDATAALTAINALIADGEFIQLPVHRGILFGAEALVKLNIEGVSDQPKIIVKALGSSGVADPIDQRQSIGFKVDGFGLAIKRPEAICVTYSIPKFAEFAALTTKALSGEFTLMDSDHIDADGEGTLRVDGVNNPLNYAIPGSPVVDGYNDYKAFSASAAYAVGDLVIKDNKLLVFTTAHSAGAWDDADVEPYVATLEDNPLDTANSKTSNTK